MLNFTTDFSASIEMIKWFLSLFLLMWHITLIDFHILNHPFWPWEELNLVMVHELFLFVAGFGFLFVCWECLHLYSPKILACNFFGSVFVWFCYQSYWFLHRMSCSLLANLLEEFGKNWYKLFLYIYIFEYTCEAISTWTFVCKKFFVLFYYQVYFTSTDWSVQVLLAVLVGSVFLEIVHYF